MPKPLHDEIVRFYLVDGFFEPQARQQHLLQDVRHEGGMLATFKRQISVARVFAVGTNGCLVMRQEKRDLGTLFHMFSHGLSESLSAVSLRPSSLCCTCAAEQTRRPSA